MNMDTEQRLVGKKVKRIFMNEDYLKFETDSGNVVFGVEGDCCSHSYFHDFIGVSKLLENGKIISVKEIRLSLSEEEQKEVDEYEDINVYGFEIVTEHSTFGEQTSVFSFRNSSNGYYGGSLEYSEDREVSPEIFNDVLEASHVGK